ncbi:MAG: glycerophosphodiester phosphodiesterase [Oscillospiraceae bacterium]|nr:glycerophosphodiester phosphodiesterase [Oscillospiraceae bacterium]
MDKKYLKPCLTAALALAAVPVYAVAPGHISRRQRSIFRGVNYAHRGLHTRDKVIPENSLPAFRQAAKEGYGIELDVQLSKDGEVVVFHDDTLDRVCGVHARVDDLTYAELSQLRLCGTDEEIPLFEDVLKSIRGCEALIVELKNGPRNRELCEKTKALLESYHGNVCIESFNPLIVAWFRVHAPELVRGQLATSLQNYADDGIRGFKAFVLHNTMLNFLARPQFIAYRIGYRPPLVRLATALGAMNIGWTSHEPRNEHKRDAVIFEFYRPRQRYQ